MACVFTCFEPLKTVETIILWLINLINGLQNDTKTELKEMTQKLNCQHLFHNWRLKLGLIRSLNDFFA